MRLHKDKCVGQIQLALCRQMWYTVGARLCVSAARKENDYAETRSRIEESGVESG
ncbi:MAG: hypothetical protein J6A30_01350 [Ruminococcus sp.]|nr:hypothetical protein [Ruminococcus sp.]